MCKECTHCKKVIAANARVCSGCGGRQPSFEKEDSVTRYVVTHIGTKGMRTLTQGMQGRYTYATAEEAEGMMDAILNGENNNDIPGVYGEQAVGTFEVRPVPCYPGHFDPKTRWF